MTFFVDSLLASNSSTRNKLCRSVCTQDPNLLLRIIMDMVEVGAILAFVACSFGYVLFIVQDFHLGYFTRIFNATGITPISPSRIIE
jgi:hypothetical protein